MIIAVDVLQATMHHSPLSREWLHFTFREFAHRTLRRRAVVQLLTRTACWKIELGQPAVQSLRRTNLGYLVVQLLRRMDLHFIGKEVCCSVASKTIVRSIRRR